MFANRSNGLDPAVIRRLIAQDLDAGGPITKRGVLYAHRLVFDSTWAIPNQLNGEAIAVAIVREAVLDLLHDGHKVYSLRGGLLAAVRRRAERARVASPSEALLDEVDELLHVEGVAQPGLSASLVQLLGHDVDLWPIAVGVLAGKKHAALARELGLTGEEVRRRRLRVAALAAEVWDPGLEPVV